MPILEAAAALGVAVEGRRAHCFNGSGHKGGRDDHPSLTFYPDSNRYMCYVCGAHGDLIDLVRAVHGVTFTQAVQWIETQTGGQAAQTAPRVPVAAISRVPDAAAIDVYAALCESTYKIGPEQPAGRYLLGRGLDLDLVNRHRATQMGEFRELWGQLLEKFGHDRLNRAGLVSKSGNFLFARHQLLLFYFDDGAPVFVQARDTTGQSKCKELSLANFHSPVPYNVDLLRQKPDLVYLCEGCIDTLSALQMGYPAVGVPGVQGFRAEWFEFFKGVGRVRLLFDNDQAGLDQAAQLRGQFRLRGIKADAFRTQDVKDVNDLLQETQRRASHG